jgi:hypothetical protein
MMWYFKGYMYSSLITLLELFMLETVKYLGFFELVEIKS